MCVAWSMGEWEANIFCNDLQNQSLEECFTWKPLNSTQTGNGPGGAVLPGLLVMGTVTVNGSFTGRVWCPDGRVDSTWSCTTFQTYGPSPRMLMGSIVLAAIKRWGLQVYCCCCCCDLETRERWSV